MSGAPSCMMHSTGLETTKAGEVCPNPPLLWLQSPRLAPVAVARVQE